MTQTHAHSSPWQQQVQVTAYGFNEAYPIIWLVFEFLSFVTLLVFLLWSCFVRQPRGDPKKPLPLKALIGSILSYACARITNIITLLLGIFHATVHQSYIVVSMLNQIFYLIAIILGFFIFWYLVQKLLERVAEKKPRTAFTPVAIIHWVVLSILSAAAIAECALYIAFMVKGVEGKDGYASLVLYYNQFSSALSIVCWVASMEILGWIIFASVQLDQKAGLTPLNISTFTFFLLNLVMAILQIQYVLLQNLPPDYLNAVRSIIEFLCTLGIYTGLLLCFRKWYQVHISPPQAKIGEIETAEGLGLTSVSSAHDSIQSYNSLVHYQHREQLKHMDMRYSVPQGAPEAQQVHMWVPR